MSSEAILDKNEGVKKEYDAKDGLAILGFIWILASSGLFNENLNKFITIYGAYYFLFVFFVYYPCKSLKSYILKKVLKRWTEVLG